jgi:hypothetical protein
MYFHDPLIYVNRMVMLKMMSWLMHSLIVIDENRSQKLMMDDFVTQLIFKKAENFFKIKNAFC